MVWLSIIVYLFAPLGATEGVVLCFGADGHIMVESAPMGFQCGQSSRRAGESTSCIHSAMESDFSIEKSKSCIDIPLIANIYGQSRCPDKNTVLHINTPKLFRCPFFQYDFADLAIGHTSNQPLIKRHSTLDSIQTVILLI